MGPDRLPGGRAGVAPASLPRAAPVIIPLSGWLVRALSTRSLFVLSCGGFTVMSVCCALAWNLPSMVVFRAFQSLFGGAMIPTVFTVIYTLFPPR